MANKNKEKSEIKWFITVFITTFILSVVFSYISTNAISALNLFPAFLILILTIFIGIVFDIIGGVMLAKILNLFLKEKINPMVGAAGISAFPMASRVVQRMANDEKQGNIILMQALGANVAGQIASAMVGGLILGFFR